MLLKLAMLGKGPNEQITAEHISECNEFRPSATV
jgi:hypothetical protein